MTTDRAETRTLDALGLPEGGPRRVTGLSVDSRDTRPGHLFAALPGTRVHGAEFISYALRMGAAAVLTDSEGAAIAAEALAESDATLVLSEDPRRALARAAARWFDRQPEVAVAVTGTNGKTSVASFTRQIWAATEASPMSIWILSGLPSLSRSNVTGMLYQSFSS